MIEARGLVRTFGDRTAVAGVDLDARPGRVLGFLGPNGAGKTTTLRMLAGAVAPTAGTIRIAGVDPATDPLGARRLLGWLPERPPLYDDMTVAAYVRHIAALRGVPRSRADEALQRARVADVADRLVGRLSKGFRQRVGLAQALVHRPKVLLLDEPASGLDPAERVELRRLLRVFADEGATVVLSTHVLPEVDELCDDVLVLHAGRVALAGALDDLRAGAVRLRVARPDGLADALRAVPGVREVTARDGAFLVALAPEARPEVARVAAAHDLLEFVPGGRLEEAFLRATGVQA